jgi:NADPH2:quinone reductase
MADDLFAAVTSGKVDIRIEQKFPLAQVREAHKALESRKTTGSTILMV